MIKSLLDQGHSVVAIAPKDEYVDRLKSLGCDYLELKMDNKGTNPIKDLFLIFRIRNIYKKSKADVFLQYTIKPNIYGTLAAKLLRKQVINNVSGLGTIFIRKNLISKVGIALYKIAFRFADHVFFQNQDDEQLFLDHSIVNEGQTGLLPGSGVDLEKFRPHYQEYGPLRFMMASRLIIDKGVKEYVEAARLVKESFPEVSFSLYGFFDIEAGLGISKSEVDHWVSDGIIDFKGSTDDMVGAMQQHDIIVLPSYREGTPKSLLEAAAMAKPIITTDVPGCREVVKHEYNGLLCQVKSAKSLAEAMVKMINFEKEKRLDLSGNSRALAQTKFDQQIVIKSYLDRIEELNGDKRN